MKKNLLFLAVGAIFFATACDTKKAEQTETTVEETTEASEEAMEEAAEEANPEPMSEI